MFGSLGSVEKSNKDLSEIKKYRKNTKNNFSKLLIFTTCPIFLVVLGSAGFSQAWAFQILSDPTGKSAIWAAQRLPDDHMTVVVSWRMMG